MPLGKAGSGLTRIRQSLKKSRQERLGRSRGYSQETRLRMLEIIVVDYRHTITMSRQIRYAILSHSPWSSRSDRQSGSPARRGAFPPFLNSFPYKSCSQGEPPGVVNMGDGYSFHLRKMCARSPGYGQKRCTRSPWRFHLRAIADQYCELGRAYVRLWQDAIDRYSSAGPTQ